jgi:hypothetical protein
MAKINQPRESVKYFQKVRLFSVSETRFLQKFRVSQADSLVIGLVGMGIGVIFNPFFTRFDNNIVETSEFDKILA